MRLVPGYCRQASASSDQFGLPGSVGKQICELILCIGNHDQIVIVPLGEDRYLGFRCPPVIERE